MAVRPQRTGVASGAVRRLLLPVLLVAVTVVAATLGLRSVPAASGEPLAPAGPPEAAPVLSARRVPVLLAGPLGERRLRAGISSLAETLPDPSCVSVSHGERTLFEAAPDAPVIPASTLKLVTAATVLSHLDASETLRTTTRSVAPPADGVLAGDLWLVGGGDPVLGTEAWGSSFERQPALRTSLEALADSVVSAGVRSVQGRVVGDESRYDTTRYVPTWPDRYRTQIGPLSALTVNDGFVRFLGGSGPFPDPPSGAAGVLTELLRARGVEVVGEPGAGVTPPEAVTEVAGIDSPPVLELVGQMLRESDNGTAELLLKEVGHRQGGQGSTEAGAAVAEATLADLGLDLEGVDVVDGSGLDRGNRVTCRLLHDLLRRVDVGGEVEGGLAVAGVTGTLARRFLDSPVSGHLRAKTGSLNNVAALAGYADTRHEGELTFAMVLNGVELDADATAVQAALAELLVAYPDVPALDELGPGAWPGLGASG
jgi:D-alanyl-D-alanine carboxypeptidase/D-alanyl-D-alanine-endopeptidase (penicillin-binding protein 4)